jgi:hypothetical protein
MCVYSRQSLKLSSSVLRKARLFEDLFCTRIGFRMYDSASLAAKVLSLRIVRFEETRFADFWLDWEEGVYSI